MSEKGIRGGGVDGPSIESAPFVTFFSPVYTFFRPICLYILYRICEALLLMQLMQMWCICVLFPHLNIHTSFFWSGKRQQLRLSSPCTSVYVCVRPCLIYLCLIIAHPSSHDVTHLMRSPFNTVLKRMCSVPTAMCYL